MSRCPHRQKYSLTIMTRKPNKLEVVEPNFNVGNSQDSQDSLSIDASEKLTLEEIVADELLDSLDWKVVKKALLKAVRRKFIRWFVSGSASMIATNEIEAEALAIGPGEEEAAA